ncbi:MAG: NAD-dependent epimerase/dehydratase family protein, partial [Gammaproteobacteria bacterium]
MAVKCVLLGGAGFMGSHLAERLLQAGHAVRVFDQPDRGPAGGVSSRRDIEWMRGDFRDPADVAAAIAGCQAVFHLVSTTLPQSSNANPAADVADNVIGTVQLLEACRREGGHKIIFASSGGTVYGVPRAVPITEEHPTHPITSYGIGKLTIEKYLELYRVLHGIDYCVLRISNPFGERQRVASGQGAVTTFLHRAHRGETIEIWGDGSVVRDYLYVGDVAEALARTVDYRGERRIVNIGSGVGRDLNEIIAAIERVIGRPVQKRHVPGRTFDVPVNVLDIRLARVALGW